MQVRREERFAGTAGTAGPSARTAGNVNLPNAHEDDPVLHRGLGRMIRLCRQWLAAMWAEKQCQRWYRVRLRSHSLALSVISAVRAAPTSFLFVPLSGVPASPAWWAWPA